MVASVLRASALAALLGVFAGAAAAQASRDIEMVFEPRVSDWPQASKRWALIIGVRDYENPQISRVPGAANDAVAMRDALIEYAGFPPEQVLLLTSDQERTMHPGRTNILRDLRSLKERIPADGLLLFAFAGHGIERNGQAFLIPSDASIFDDVDFLEQTAISLDSLKGLIRGMNAHQVIMLLDACRNDPNASRGVDAGNTMTSAQKQLAFEGANQNIEAFATIYATAVGYRAWEIMDRESGKPRGSFSTAFVEGLSGQAVDNHGQVTLLGLVQYLQKRVPELVHTAYGGQQEQRPFVQIGGYRAEDLVLSSFSEPKPAEDEVWLQTLASGDPKMFIQYLGEFPKGKMAEEARYRTAQLIDRAGGAEAVWSKWISAGSTPVEHEQLQRYTLEGYLSEYPKGQYAADAHWELIEASNEPADFERHLEQYAGSTHAKLAEQQWQTLTLAKARTTSDVAALQMLVERFPEGFYAGEARAEIERLEWEAARGGEEGNLEGIRAYLEANPNSRYEADARRLLDRILWDKAQAANTAEAYRTLLEESPNSRYSGSAQRALSEFDRQAWTRIRDSRDPAEYEAYLAAFHDGDHSVDAADRVTDINDWRRAAEAGDARGVETYLASHARGLFVNEAYSRLSEIQGNRPVEAPAELVEIESWNSARECAKAQCYAKHYEDHPRGPHADDAFFQAAASASGDLAKTYSFEEYLRRFPAGAWSETALWRLVEAQEAAAGFDRYLKQYPSGRFAELARDGLARLRFDAAKTIADYQAVVTEFPSSRYSDKAEQRVDELRKQELESLDSPGAYAAFLKDYPESRYSGWAQGRLMQLDRTAWDAVKQSRDKEEYAAYLERFPDGANSTVARDRIVEIDTWTKTVMDSSRGALEKYAAAYPAGLFVADAASMLMVSDPNAGGLTTPVDPLIGIPHMSRKDRQGYVWIPAGRFQMGCVPGDQRCRPEEKPQHAVEITKGFWLGQTEVDIDSYRRFVEDGGSGAAMPSAPLWDKKLRATNHPITGPSWGEANAFCTWAGGRLPTEAEWEYAARAGVDNAIYPLDGENSRDKANFLGKRGNDRAEFTAAVKSYDPNAYGLFDMAGNVWEWCEDYYSDAYYASSPEADPKGPTSGQEYVARGGSWNSDPGEHLRISFRTSFAKGGNLVGFRCVLDDTPATQEILVGPGVR